MAIIPRVLGNSSRFSISRPEINVRTAPRTSDYMAVDSAIPVERFLATGYVLGRTTLSFGKVSLAGIVALNVPAPLVEVVPVARGNPARLEKMPIQFASSGVVTQFAPYRYGVITNSAVAGAPYLTVTDPYNGATPTDYNSTLRDWIWFVMKAPP